jgi:HK97 family phage major capsid protein
MLTRENLAAPVAEATATTGASGTKPEGGMTFDRVSTPVETIAEWVAATKRSLSDAGQLQGIINDELRADLEEELEDQMLNGNGASPNLTGLANTSGTQTQAWATDILTTTRKGRTLVQTVGRAIPTAYVLNPTDWETIDLLQDNEARYYYGGPMDVGTPRLWGLRIVESEAQPAGAGWVGDWRKAVLWDREQAMISMSDSHDDFFTRNLVAILGELRAAWGIIRPQAFVELDLTA